MSYDELLERSQALVVQPPTEANRIAQLSDRRDEVEAHAAGVRPILHARVPALIDAFLAHKRQAGSPVERATYADMDRAAFVSRLLRQRPLTFMNSDDAYLLRDGTRGLGGFDLVGGRYERHPLTLDEVLSYDELAVSALLGVSVPTHFINSGPRHNAARPGPPGSFEPRGVYTGLVGARFERPGCMEWQHVIVTGIQNTPENGYGSDAEGPAAGRLRAWARFYERERLPTYAEAAGDESGRYLRLAREALFDTEIYRRRVRAVIEPFLLDADDRARAAGTRAYVHAVGLGLGVWKLHDRQTALMLEAYADVLRTVPLPHVADLDFSWFRGVGACGGVADGEVFRAGENAVRIQFSQRDPAAPLTGDDAGKLLVAMYAWDGGAYPGNEYWSGSLTASGDPAAACCSTIPELQNPLVNPRVVGEHARVFGRGEVARSL